jgi:hypothetical protein
VEVEGLPNLQRWMEAVGSRPAVEKGAAVPQPQQSEESDAEKAKRLENEGRKILS